MEAAPPASRGMVGKLKDSCARNAGVCLAVIIVLVIIIVAMYVYYHGVMSLGPYAAVTIVGGKKRSQSDPETEQLIETINSN